MVEKVVNIKVQEHGLDEVNAKVVRLENSLDDLEAQNKSLSSSMASSGKSVLDNGGAMGILNELTGGLAMTVKDAVEAMDLFTKSTKVQTVFQKIQTFVMGTSTGALKAFRIALISTGIGALIVGLGVLIANFDKVQKYVQMAVDKFNGMGDGIKLLISVIFPFIGAIRLIVAGLEEMGLIDDDVTAKAKKNTELRIKGLDSEKNKLTDKYDSEIRLAKAAGKSTVELEEAKRQAILKTLYALNEAERARIKSGDSTEEDIKKWNDRQKEITKLQEDSKVAEIETETERQNKIREARDAANQKAREARKKEIEDEKQRQLEAYNAGVTEEANHKEKLKELRKKYAEEQEQEELDEADRSAQAAIKAYNDKIALEQKTADEEIAIQEEVLRQKEVIAEANMNIVTKSVDLLGQLSGKSKALQKAGIIASAAIGIYSVIKDTQAANVAAIAPPPLGLGPVAGIGLQTKNTIGGALSIASITAASAKALKAVGGGSAGGGSVGGGASGGGGGSQAPSFNLVQGTGSNQIAQGLASQTRPLQAYVVASNVTSQQELDRNIVESASV